jgi:hypothetical protein
MVVNAEQEASSCAKVGLCTRARFVVAGRFLDANQRLENIGIASGFEELFHPTPEDISREDISST